MLVGCMILSVAAVWLSCFLAYFKRGSTMGPRPTAAPTTHSYAGRDALASYEAARGTLKKFPLVAPPPPVWSEPAKPFSADAPAPPLPPFERPEELESELSAAADNEPQHCLSFNRAPCPPLNLSFQSPAQQHETHKFCGPYVQKERSFNDKPLHGEAAPRFCGRRIKRLNPCWSERNVTSCLPHFFILGEMKCGTTSLYHFLRMHPRVVTPRVKEPRFLQAGRFPQTTVSRYKVNFEAATTRDDLVTFDASPVYLRSQLARAYISRWLPRARLIVLVRNPSQRAYSHVTMGLSWMASKCTAVSELSRLEPLRPLLTFEKLMERSLLQQTWTGCTQQLGRDGRNPHSFQWVVLPKEELPKLATFRRAHPAEDEARAEEDEALAAGNAAAPVKSGAPMWDCLRKTDASLARAYEDELTGRWPLDDERRQLDDAAQLLGHCSEMMLFPPGALTKGTRASPTCTCTCCAVCPPPHPSPLASARPPTHESLHAGAQVRPMQRSSRSGRRSSIARSFG